MSLSFFRGSRVSAPSALLPPDLALQASHLRRLRCCGKQVGPPSSPLSSPSSAREHWESPARSKSSKINLTSSGSIASTLRTAPWLAQVWASGRPEEKARAGTQGRKPRASWDSWGVFLAAQTVWCLAECLPVGSLLMSGEVIVSVLKMEMEMAMPGVRGPVLLHSGHTIKHLNR